MGAKKIDLILFLERNILSLALLIVVLIPASGCFFASGEFTADEPLNNAESIIKVNKTTKAEILKAFGPPIAIARKGTTITFPSPGPRKEGYKEVASETFFELFSTKHNLTEDYIVYYYHSSTIKESFFFFIIPGSYQKSLIVNKLWILINEKTGVVEDYLLREEK